MSERVMGMNKGRFKHVLFTVTVIGIGVLVINLIDAHTVMASQSDSGDSYAFIRKLQKPARLAAAFFSAWGFAIIIKGDSAKGLRRIYLALAGYAGIMGLNWLFNFIDGFFGW